MPTVQTFVEGPSRTLVASGVISGVLFTQGSERDSGPPVIYGPRGPEQTATFLVYTPWGRIYANSISTANPINPTTEPDLGCGPDSFQTNLSWAIATEIYVMPPGSTFGDDPGGETVYDPQIDGTWDSVCGPGYHAIDISGTWTASADVELIREVTTGDSSAPGPAYAGGLGGQPPDPPHEATERFYERYKLGGTLSISITSAGMTVTSTQTVVSGIDTECTYENVVTGNVDVSTAIYSMSYGTFVTSDITLDVSAVFGISGTTAPLGIAGYVFSDATTTIDATNGISLYATTDSGGHPATCSLSLDSYPPRSYTTTGALWDMEGANTVPLTVVATNGVGGGNTSTTVTGSFSDAKTQLRYAVEGYTNATNRGLLSANDQQPLTYYVDPASLNAAGFDATMWRMAQRGTFFDAVSISQAAAFTLDASPSTSTYTAGAHTVISGTGPLVAVVSGGLGSFSGDYVTPIYPQSYRWMRVHLTADAAGQPARITIGAASWSVVVGTTGYVDIDLCDAYWSGDTSVADSFWPADSHGGGGWGVDAISGAGGIVFDNLANGHTYTLAKLEMVQKDHSRLTILPSFQAFRNLETNTPPQTDAVERLVMGDTDGRLSFEMPSMDINTNTGTMVITYGVTSIVEITTGSFDWATVGTGWSATDLAPAPGGCSPLTAFQAMNCYLNSGAPATWLGGWQFIANAWVSTFDLDASAPLTLVAQVQRDHLAGWPPVCGDIDGIGSGSTTGPFEIAVTWTRGSAVRGILLQSGTPVGGVTVNVVKHAGGAAQGSGTSDAVCGEYLTGAPYIGDDAGSDITLASVSPPTVTNLPIPQRYIQRVCFIVTTTVGPYDVDVLAYRVGYYMAYTDASGNVSVTMAWSPDMMPGAAVTVDSHMDCHEPRLSVRERDGALACVYSRKSGPGSRYELWRQFSYDWGATWTVDGGAVYKSAGVDLKHAVEVYDTFWGYRLFFYNDGSGGGGTGLIQCDIYNSMQPEVLIGTFPAGGGGIGGLTADDSSFGATAFTNPTHGIDVAFVVGGARKRFRTYDGGVTWTGPL